MDAIQEKLQQLPTGRDEASTRRRKALFRQVDGNGNGFCTLAELDGAVKNGPGIGPIGLDTQVTKRAYHAARDISPPVKLPGSEALSDSYLDLCEFRVFLVYLQHYHELHTLFVSLDKSVDGRLGVDEFVQSASLLQSWGVVLEDPVASFAQMDADGGGMVLFDEFAHWALQQGVTNLNADAADRADALKVLKAAKANLSSKDFDDMQHAKFSVEEGIQGQGALGIPRADSLLPQSDLEILVATVHRATGLRIADRTTSDPYVVLSYGDVEHRSHIIKQNLNPIWDESFHFPDPGTALEINIFDYDVKSSDDFLGRVVVEEAALQEADGHANSAHRRGNGHRQKCALTGPGAEGTIEVSFRWQKMTAKKGGGGY